MINDDHIPKSTFLGKFSWATFDWANQPYYTLITTFIFAPYFATVFVGDGVRGQELWGYTQSLAGLFIALLSPVLGAIADSMGRRKPFLAVFSLLFSLSALGLWLAVPGHEQALIPVMFCLVVMAMTMEITVVFNNAMLPGLGAGKSMGRWSGFAWGWGYVGGLVALIVVLLYIAFPAEGNAPGFLIPVVPEEVPFNLDVANQEHNRIVGPISSLWFLIFIIPLFLFTPDHGRKRKPLVQAAREGMTTLRQTLIHVRQYRNIIRFLIARMLYADGLSAIFAFGGIYGAGTFGWKITTLGMMGILLSLFGIVGAFAGGVIDDWLGSKRTIFLSLSGLIIGTIGAFSITPDTAFFVIPLEPGTSEGLFSSPAEQIYLAFVSLIGLCGGPLQAASRTMLARIAPMNMMTEFYGLYALSGKATAFLAPFAIALMTAFFESQRVGFAPVILFLIAGFWILIPVKEERSEPEI